MLGQSDKLKFTEDILFPSLHTLEILAVDAVGARTLTDRLSSQAQSREQLTRQNTAVQAARTAAAQELNRTARLQALQNVANTIIGTTSSTAVTEAALQEQLTAIRAAEQQKQQIAAAERDAQRQALLREFAS
jgi:hypothetical protein